MNYDASYTKTNVLGMWKLKEDGSIVWAKTTEKIGFETVLREWQIIETINEELSPESQGLLKNCSFPILIVKDSRGETNEFETKKTKAFYQQIITIAIKPDNYNIFLRYNPTDKRYYIFDPIGGVCQLVPFQSNNNIVCRRSAIKKCNLSMLKLSSLKVATVSVKSKAQGIP